MSLKKDYLAKPFEKFWLLNTDITPLIRKHSPTLPNKGYVHVANNKVKGNKPVDIGFSLSVIGLSARRPLYNMGGAAWNLPMSMRLFDSEDHKNSSTAKQVNDLLGNEDFPFGKELTVNCLDSNYSTPEYIAGTGDQPNLVNIIRLASNRNVWDQLSPWERDMRRQNNDDNRGANAVYGGKYKLNDADNWDKKPDEESLFGIRLANGKHRIVEVKLYKNMLIRSKRGKNMKDKVFNLVSIRLLNEDGTSAIFKRRIWLGIWGKRRAEIDLEEIYWAYRNRYDIEHFFRYGKQKLLLDKNQTPDIEHLQNWMEIVSMAYWLLWVGKDQAKPKARPWQKYDENYQKRIKFDSPPSPSQVQQQMESIILGFEQTPFLPKPPIKGRPRQKGELQTKRATYDVVIKGKTGKKKPK